MKIHVLPDLVVNQIAAGEVIERPASVIRELVDNSVDAGSTDILVALEGGGHSRMRVRDNGCGMSRDDAMLAFERHATSKVGAIEDLWTLSTLGFRGEALASIAAVSKVKLTTKEAGATAGTQVIIRGGKIVSVDSCAWGEGTEIEIEHLFFNTPARRKFLKSPRSEVTRIRTWLMHSALSRPHVRYRLLSDGDEVVNLPRVDTIGARARSVFADGLMTVSLSEGGITVTGLVAHPGEAVADTTGLVILVNGRLVADKMIARAAREGFDSMLKDREFPVGYLVVDLPPELVDVNVHPQKSEVRFRHSDQIFAVVRGAVLTAVRKMKRPGHVVTQPFIHTPSFNNSPHNQSASIDTRAGQNEYPTSALPFHSTAFQTAAFHTADASASYGAAHTAIPEFPIASFDQREYTPHTAVEPSKGYGVGQGMAAPQLFSTQPSTPSAVQANKSTHLQNLAAFLTNRSANLDEYPSPPQVSEPPSQAVSQAQLQYRFSDLRYIGQLLQCYLLCEYGEEFVIVDMHAAHERVNYNKIRNARAKHTVKTQHLLLPLTIRLTEEQVDHLIDQVDILKELGFEISEKSRSEIAVTGVPSMISHLNVSQVVKELAAEPVVAGWRERIEERIDHIAARLACHASVRSGDLLARDEVYALFAQLDDSDLAVACPHGRPVVAHFPRKIVEQWFGRDR